MSVRAGQPQPLNVTWGRAIAFFTGVAIAVGVATHFADVVWQPAEEQRWIDDSVTPILRKNYLDAISPDKQNDPYAHVPRVTEYHPPWTLPTAAVYTSPNTKAPSAPLTLKDLSNDGQAHAIDFVAHGSEKAADVAWARLSKTLTGMAGGEERRDPYRADRTLVATVTKGLDANPGDRLLWTRVFVQPINFEFAGYSIASTDTKSIVVANIENTRTSSLTLDAGLETALPGLAKPGVKPSVESSQKTKAEISQQYENLGVDIRPDFLRIIRESAAGGDVAGNTAIELSILTDPTMILKTEPDSKLRGPVQETLALVVANAHLTDGVQYLEEPEATITVHPQNILPHCPLMARVWMVYEMRQIVGGGNHYVEGLQHVHLIKDGEIKHEVEIVRADDIAPAVWSIRRQSNPSDGSKPQGLGDLRAKTPDGNWRNVLFTDYVTASELTHWLKAHANKPSLNKMEFDYAKEETLIPFKNVENACLPM